MLEETLDPAARNKVLVEGIGAVAATGIQRHRVIDQQAEKGARERFY